MARIVTFADTFVSATAPAIEGFGQEEYAILNNVSGQSLFTINPASYTSAFIYYELMREDETTRYVEVGELKLMYNDGTWYFSKGLTSGDQITNTIIEYPYNLIFSITTSLNIGTLKYTTGDLGVSNIGYLKINISRTPA